MPTYEYECRKCGRIFDHFQSMKDEPLKSCPAKGCRGRVQRLVSAGSGLIFKGSGFYETDYKKKSGGSGKNGTAKPKPCPAAENKTCPSAGSCPAAAGGD